MANDLGKHGTQNSSIPSSETETLSTLKDDAYRKGMLHAAQLCRNEFGCGWKVAMQHSDSSGYQSGYEDACDHLSIAIEQAAVISCTPVNSLATNSMRVAELEAALRELVISPIDFDDARISYVSMQVDRNALEAARALAEKE
jgi:hypothetical protein